MRPVARRSPFPPPRRPRLVRATTPEPPSPWCCCGERLAAITRPDGTPDLCCPSCVWDSIAVALEAAGIVVTAGLFA